MKLRQLLGALARAPRKTCFACDGAGTVPAFWAFSREMQCTCGTGSARLAFHDAHCDSVPCPFCQLEDA